MLKTLEDLCNFSRAAQCKQEKAIGSSADNFYEALNAAVGDRKKLKAEQNSWKNLLFWVIFSFFFYKYPIILLIAIWILSRLFQLFLVFLGQIIEI